MKLTGNEDCPVNKKANKLKFSAIGCFSHCRLNGNGERPCNSGVCCFRSGSYLCATLPSSAEESVHGPGRAVQVFEALECRLGERQWATGTRQQ